MAHKPAQDLAGAHGIVNGTGKCNGTKKNDEAAKHEQHPQLRSHAHEQCQSAGGVDEGSTDWPLVPMVLDQAPAQLFWWCFALRVINSVLLRTTFAPDEYWQSQEVAHRLVFE
jgi:hypothetical protein